jgi:hypothetical protein
MSDSAQGDGWITDRDAIHTLVAMRLIRPGDQIIIQNAEGYNIGKEFNGKIIKVEEQDGALVGEPSQDNCIYAGHLVAFHFATGWVGCEENIAAWRRPLKEVK